MTGYAAILILVAGGCATAGTVVWQRRGLAVRTSLSLLMWALAEWSLLTGLAAIAVGLGPQMALTKLELIGACSSPLLLLTVALEWAGLQRYLTIRNQLLLWIVPAATLCMGAINPWGLMWRGARLAPGTSILLYEHGLGFWVATTYLYAVMAASVWLVGMTLATRRAAPAPGLGHLDRRHRPVGGQRVLCG